jgi:RNA polymerase sigma-70 factor, ECF subfamily
MYDEREADLVRSSKAGDAEAFGKLVDAHQKILFNVAYRMVGSYHEAQDLTQAAFVKAYERLPAYDGRGSWFGWVYRILLNETLNHLARRKRRGQVEAEDERSGGPEPETEFGERETERIVREALELLAEDYRQVIVMRHFVQLSYREMSDALHVPEKTIKSRLFTARQQLREILVRRGVRIA